MNEALRKRLKENARRVFDEYGITGTVRIKTIPTTRVPAFTASPIPRPNGCRVCGADVEQTGRPGRPFTKCMKHRGA